MLLILFLACHKNTDGDVSVDTAPDTAADTGADTAVDRASLLVDYSGGSCPDLSAEQVTDFLSAGEARTFYLDLPPDPVGKPVLFLWHWLGGNATQARRAFDWTELAQTEDVILVTPESCCSTFEWQFTFPSDETNLDLAFFDDVLSCLYQQYNVDLDRVWSTGMSAGGLWTTYLTVHRSQYLAATAPFSGGTDPIVAYTPPEDAIPVMVSWGGEADVLNIIDFNELNQTFVSELLADGHFVVSCDHGEGHTIPNGGPEAALEFLLDHPKGLSPEPYADGLPEDYPSYCALAE